MKREQELKAPNPYFKYRTRTLPASVNTIIIGAKVQFNCEFSIINDEDFFSFMLKNRIFECWVMSTECCLGDNMYNLPIVWFGLEMLTFCQFQNVYKNRILWINMQKHSSFPAYFAYLYHIRRFCKEGKGCNLALKISDFPMTSPFSSSTPILPFRLTCPKVALNFFWISAELLLR